MGNFTYSLNYSTTCSYPGVTIKGGGTEVLRQGIQRHVFETPMNLSGDYVKIPALVFRDPFSNLRFVVCGVRNWGRGPIWQLTSVFDTNIWIWLVFTVMTICVSNSVVQKYVRNHQLSSSWIGICKVFLEQSEPFPNIIAVRYQLKIVPIALLFGGLIISNAYKSSNLYQMTRSRKPMTFDTLEHLNYANYTLYTRMAVGEYRKNSRDPKQWVPWFHGNWTTMKLKQYVVISKLHTPGIQVYRWSDLVDPLEVKEHANLIMKLKKSVPNALETIKLAFDNYVDNKQIENLRSVNALRNTFSHWQDVKLLDNLRSCRSAAVLLPEHISEEYRKVLHHERKFAYVSKQRYPRKPNGISFAGLLTRSFIVKVGSLVNSGIINRWENLYSFGLYTRSVLTHEGFNATKLSGSIILIFKVLIVGNLTALTVFLLEKGYKIVLLCGCKRRTN